MIEGFVCGFEIFHPGIFLGRKSCQVFFGGLDLSVICLGVQNNLRIRGITGVSRPRSPSNKVEPYLLRLGNAAWDFLGLRFGPGNFWFCWKP